MLPSSPPRLKASTAERLPATAKRKHANPDRTPSKGQGAFTEKRGTPHAPRALRLVRDEGLLEFRRGRGIALAGTPERGAVVRRAKELITFARSQGYQLDELVEIIEQVG